MKYVEYPEGNDPTLNLALEEVLLKNKDITDDLIMFYVNKPSVIIGRHQNTIEEVNMDYIEAHDVCVVRRLSGGGAVYHDLGNLNFSFLTDNREDRILNFRHFTEPVIRTLRKMGVPAELTGRNDIVVEGRKISGNAQYISGGRMYSHGTLLFNSDLSRVSQALKVKPGKIESKGIKSVRSRVANISEYLPSPIELAEFRAALLEELADGKNELSRYRVSDAEWQGALALADERYRTWDWNFGRSPDFNVQRARRFPCGEVDVRMDVKEGLIHWLHFYGDFMGGKEPDDLAAQLTGVRYARPEIAAALSGWNLSQYFPGVSMDEFLEFLV